MDRIKKIETFKLDKNLRKLKYIISIVFVIILPLFLVDILGQGSPYFCKLISPIGMVKCDKEKCISCGKCKKVCQMNIDPVENCNHLECIRCGRCKNACPVDTISCGIKK